MQTERVGAGASAGYVLSGLRGLLFGRSVAMFAGMSLTCAALSIAVTKSISRLGYGAKVDYGIKAGAIILALGGGFTLKPKGKTVVYIAAFCILTKLFIILLEKTPVFISKNRSTATSDRTLAHNSQNFNWETYEVSSTEPKKTLPGNVPALKNRKLLFPEGGDVLSVTPSGWCGQKPALEVPFFNYLNFLEIYYPAYNGKTRIGQLNFQSPSIFVYPRGAIDNQNNSDICRLIKEIKLNDGDYDSVLLKVSEREISWDTVDNFLQKGKKVYLCPDQGNEFKARKFYHSIIKKDERIVALV